MEGGQIICLILSTISSGLCVIKPVQFCRLKLSPGCCEDYKRSFPGVGSNTLGSSLEHLALVIVGGIAGGDIAAPMCQQYIYLVLLFFIHTCFLTKKTHPKITPQTKNPKETSPNAQTHKIYPLPLLIKCQLSGCLPVSGGCCH